MTTTHRRIITLGQTTHAGAFSPPPPPMTSQALLTKDEPDEPDKGVGLIELYLCRFRDWCKAQGLQDWALVLTAILARIISATLTIRLAVEMGRGQSILLSVLFGVLLELASGTFAWFAIVHPHEGIRLAARVTTATLIMGSMVASVTWLSKSVSIQNKRMVTESIEFQGAETERKIIQGRLENLSKISVGDIDNGYRKRALDTDEKINKVMEEYTKLGKDQQELMSDSAQTGALLIPFVLAACMLEVIGILAFALWRYRDEDDLSVKDDLTENIGSPEPDCCNSYL